MCERIPTIGTQLKILSTVKATMLGAQGECACAAELPHAAPSDVSPPRVSSELTVTIFGLGPEMVPQFQFLLLEIAERH